MAAINQVQMTYKSGGSISSQTYYDSRTFPASGNSNTAHEQTIMWNDTAQSFLHKLNDLAKEGHKFVMEIPIPGEPSVSNLMSIDQNNLCKVQLTKSFEQLYNKPANSILVSRTAFPLGDSKGEWDAVLENHCPDNDKRWTDDGRLAYKEFAKAMKNGCVRTIRSKLYFHFMKKCKNSSITLKGCQINNVDELFKSWTTEEMTQEKCKGTFDILYGSLERENIHQKIEIETILEHAIYFSAADNIVNRRVIGGRTRESMILQTTRNKVRDIYRNKFTKIKLAIHGVKLTVSRSETTAARTKRKNKEGEFIFSVNVKGWMSDQHKAFNQQFNKDRSAQSFIGDVGGGTATAMIGDGNRVSKTMRANSRR